MSSDKPNNAKKPIYLRTWFIVTVALLVLGLIGSMNPSKKVENSSTTTTSETKEPAVTFESMGCLKVSPRLLNGIGTGFGGSKLSGKAAGFKASEYKDVKFISLEFTPKGESTPQTAIFGTNDDDLSDDVINGLIVPVDGFAKEFSDWGQSGRFQLSISDKGATESKQCLTLLKK
jgi:hypothetical protein